MGIWRFSNRNQGLNRDFFDGGTGAIPKTKWKMRRDTDANRLLCTPADGEPFWTGPDPSGALDNRLFIGDGVTPGGILIGGEGGAGSGGIYTLDSSGFDGVTTVFTDLLPYAPDVNLGILIFRSGAPVLFDSGHDEPNPGQFSYSGQDVTFGIAPRIGDQAVAIFVHS